MYFSDMLYPYVKNAQMFRCPSTGTNATAYGWNLNMGYVGNHATRVTPEYTGIPMASVAFPAETVLIADSDWTGSTADYKGSNANMLTIPYHPSRFTPARHNGGSNFVLADGHAKWYTCMIDPAMENVNVGPIKQTLPPAGLKWMPNGSR